VLKRSLRTDMTSFEMVQLLGRQHPWEQPPCRHHLHVQPPGCQRAVGRLGGREASDSTYSDDHAPAVTANLVQPTEGFLSVINPIHTSHRRADPSVHTAADEGGH
jgi:hypothetical protein